MHVDCGDGAIESSLPKYHLDVVEVIGHHTHPTTHITHQRLVEKKGLHKVLKKIRELEGKDTEIAVLPIAIACAKLKIAPVSIVTTYHVAR